MKGCGPEACGEMGVQKEGVVEPWLPAELLRQVCSPAMPGSYLLPSST